MYEINFYKPTHIYFIGIGGISMSGLAEILLQEGFRISGSDLHRSPLTEQLESQGAAIYYGQRASNIEDDVSVVVYTAAIHPDNPEYQEAERRGIAMLTRAQLLGQLMKNYKTSIGVSGTHGKTTTTSLLTQVLLETDIDPTISVGGIMPAIGGNIRVGSNQVFVTEACEYTNSFLSFFPNMEIILNIEEDHLDFFKDIQDIRHSFHQYMKLLPAHGILVINSDIQDLEQLTSDLSCQIITFGSNPKFSDYSACDITFNHSACASYTVVHKKEDGSLEDLGRIELSIPGMHNVSNSLSVIALAKELGLSMETIARGLHKFTGTNRRFEKKGERNGVTIIDDYAHHPQEITATLNTAQNYPHRDIWCVFQPHTYTRTFSLMDDFAKALSLADHVVLADIYAARETNTLGISSKDLQKKLHDLGTDAYYFPSFEEIQKFLLKNCINGDLLITMGAGDIVIVGENLLKQ